VARKKKSTSAIPGKTLLIWGGAALFTAVWMFVLGILVGRGTAPVNLEVGKLEKELADLKAAMTRKEHAEIDARTTGKGDGKPHLGFYEALKDPKRSKPFTPKSPGNEKTRQPPKPARAEKRVQPKSNGAKKTPSQSSTRPDRKPAAKPVASDTGGGGNGTGRYTIQVAAVQTSDNAERLVMKLRKKGYPAYQVRVQVKGKGVWHRVRVGAFKNRTEAERMLAKLKAGRHGGQVVRTN
jgi:cell division septation protein DedD